MLKEFHGLFVLIFQTLYLVYIKNEHKHEPNACLIVVAILNFQLSRLQNCFDEKKHTAVMLIYTESSGERESNVAICVELKLK